MVQSYHKPPLSLEKEMGTKVDAVQEHQNEYIETLVKFRLEECENGWLCVESQAKDAFAGRRVFKSTAELCRYLMQRFPDTPVKPV